MSYYLKEDEIRAATCFKLGVQLSNLQWQFIKVLLMAAPTCHLEDADIEDDLPRIKKMLQLVAKVSQPRKPE